MKLSKSKTIYALKTYKQTNKNQYNTPGNEIAQTVKVLCSLGLRT